MNTLIAISHKKIVVLCNQEKSESLKVIQDKMKKSKLDMTIICKSGENLEISKFVDEVKKELKDKEGKKVRFGGFLKEKQKGKMIEEFEAQLAKIDHDWVEISPQIQDLICVKREEDFPLIKKSAKLVDYFYKLLLEEVEEIIDKEKKIKHSDITRKIEQLLIENKHKYEQELVLKHTFADLAYSPIVQSGGTYNLKPNAESNEDVLKYDCVMLSVGAKYMEYNTNVVRTLFIDASEEEKSAYQNVYEAERMLIKMLKPGAVLKDIYDSVFKFLCQKNQAYKDFLPNNFGFGVSTAHQIGLEFRESCLVINSKAERKVEANMVFNIILSLRDLRTKGGRNYAIMLSDTVKVTPQGPEILTSEVPKKLEYISYCTEEDGEENKEDDVDHDEQQKFKLDNLKEGEIFTRSKRRGTQVRVEEEKMNR